MFIHVCIAIKPEREATCDVLDTLCFCACLSIDSTGTSFFAICPEEGQSSWPKRLQSLLSSFKLVPEKPNLQKPTEKLPLLPWLYSVLQSSVDHSSPLSPEMAAYSITVIRSNPIMTTVSSNCSFSQQKEQQCQPQLKHKD